MPRVQTSGPSGVSKKWTDLMRHLGTLNFSPRGHSLWTTPQGNPLFLSQFRDSVLVAGRGPSARTEMQQVTYILLDILSLPVLCECMTEDNWLWLCCRLACSPLSQLPRS